MGDFAVDFGTFASTTVTITAESGVAKAWLAQHLGFYVLSMEIPKSSFQAFSDLVTAAGMGHN